MQREINSLASSRFDLVVVGGGIYGAAAAWEAARRGLGVALVEAGDFGAGASANSLKVIHSGFRYLQSLDFARVRLSAGELANLLAIAPHLVSPVPCLVATRGLGKQGRPAFAIALSLYNQLISNDKLRGRLVSRDEALAQMSACPLPGISGGALWYEGVVHDSERLTLAYVHSAVQQGAQAANYLRATGLLRENGRVIGVSARDELTGGELEVRGRVVLLTAGVWSAALLGRPWPEPALASAVNLVLKRRLSEVLVGLRSLSDRRADPVCGGGRFMFMVPWRERTMLGTAYRLWSGEPRPAGPTARELLGLLDEFNAACPGLELGPEDIGFYHWGLVPLAAPGRPPAGGGLATKRRIEEQAGVVLVSGAKYTTARAVAAEAVERACAQLGRPCPAPPLEPLWGGEAGRDDMPSALPAGAAAHLRAQYGSRAGEVAARAGGDPALLQPLAPGSPVLGCEVAHAVEAEMALTLGDVSLRRTVLGKAGRPSKDALAAAAGIMAARLGWDRARQAAEMARALEPYQVLEGLG
jgi:glycerol-3-phosphate dehydrogenase